MKTFYLLVLVLICNSCYSQTEKGTSNQLVGGPCQGCEAIYEFGDQNLNSVDTLPGYQKNEPKLNITGTVYQLDGKTPAANIILYIYHTNRQGIYEIKEGEAGWAKKHGFIRGWIKTGEDGRYSFYTFRPASYPNRTEPEHIHITIKEPDKNEYYIDNYVFDDDTLLTMGKRKALRNRGGSGIIKLEQRGNTYAAKRDIILGLNIPNY